MDEVLSAPEIARVIDRALAGPLPEEIARSVVRHRVLERVVDELAASGEVERLFTAALASPRTLELTDRMLASEEMEHALRRVTSSPKILGRDWKADGGARRRGCGWCPCVGSPARRPRRACGQSPQASRPVDFARRRDAGAGARHRCDCDDCDVHGGGRSRRNSGVARWRLPTGVACRHPALGRLDPHRGRVLRALLEHRGTHARDADDAASPRNPGGGHSFGRPIDRSPCRARACDSADVPRLRPSAPSDRRRRGLADFLAGTVVLYDDATTSSRV